MTSNMEQKFIRYVYWVKEEDFKRLSESLTKEGVKVAGVMMAPCEVLKASGNKALFASPNIWSRICKRQGSWYRSSDKFGKYVLVSDKKLSPVFDDFLEAQITESGFVPETLPTDLELQKLVDSENYSKKKPDEWENPGLKDSVMFKILFSITGFWGWGDNLKKYWLSHRANHANYLCHHFTVDIEEEAVPYSIAENAGICSSCVEFFNVVDESSRKLVRACPGAVTFGRAKRKTYYDVKPVKGSRT